MLPRVSYLLKSEEVKEVERMIQKSLNYVLTISIPLSIYFYLSAPEIIQLIAGAKFLHSIPVLSILSFLPVIIGLGNIFGIQILLPYGKESSVLFSAGIGCIISILLNFILCPLYKETGAAISCVVTELCVTIILGIASLKSVKLSFPLKLIVGVLFSSILFIPLISFTESLTEIVWKKLVLSAFLCGSIYSMAQLFLFSNPIAREIFNTFSKYIVCKNVSNKNS
jgi:O-antigen/teichoic acid export membrane protein